MCIGRAKVGFEGPETWASGGRVSPAESVESVRSGGGIQLGGCWLAGLFMLRLFRVGTYDVGEFWRIGAPGHPHSNRRWASSAVSGSEYAGSEMFA